MDLRSSPGLRNAFVEAGVQAGWPYNADFNGASQLGVGPYQATHRNGERCSAAKGYLTPQVRARPNLTVVTAAHTTRVLTESGDAGLRATGVEFTLGGPRGVVRQFHVGAGGEVVLSAGAFGSPQLLLLSGIGPGAQLQAHGLPVVHDLPGVGANFHDHPDTVLVVNAPAAREAVGILPSQLPRYLRAAALWRRERQGLLTSNFAEAGGFLHTDASEMLPDLQLHFIIAKLQDHGRKVSFGNGYSCHVCLLRPKSRGTVRLAGPDPFAAPLIDPAFLTHPDDVRRLIQGVRLSREILRQPALAQFGGQEAALSRHATTDAELEHFIRSTSDTVYHPVGSCRMGPDVMAVVDAELRVHGVRGLRVADASIMPAINGGNTNAPTIMIGEKAADLLRAARRQA
jgi:choline dehydrogenase-like flavoprotein